MKTTKEQDYKLQQQANELYGKPVVIPFWERVKYCQTSMILDEWIHRFTKGHPEDDWIFWSFLTPYYQEKR